MAFSSWSTGGRLGAVVEPGVRDVAEALPDVAIPDLGDVSQPSLTPRATRKSHRNRRFAFFSVLRRVWIPLVILAVIGAGGWTVSRLHGVFGAEKRPLYADTKVNDTTPFNPKHMTYEVFGPPGTVATSATSTSILSRSESRRRACRGRWSSPAPRRRPWQASRRREPVTASAAASWWTAWSKRKRSSTKRAHLSLAS